MWARSCLWDSQEATPFSTLCPVGTSRRVLRRSTPAPARSMRRRVRRCGTRAWVRSGRPVGTVWRSWFRRLAATRSSPLGSGTWQPGNSDSLPRSCTRISPAGFRTDEPFFFPASSGTGRPRDRPCTGSMWRRARRQLSSSSSGIPPSMA